MNHELKFLRSTVLLITTLLVAGCSSMQDLLAPKNPVQRMQFHNGEWYTKDHGMVAIGKSVGGGSKFVDLKEMNCPTATGPSSVSDCQHTRELISESFSLNLDKICEAEPTGREPGNKRRLAWIALCTNVLISKSTTCSQLIMLDMNAKDPRQDKLQLLRLPEAGSRDLGSTACGQTPDEGGGEGGGYAGGGTPRPEIPPSKLLL